MEPQEDKDKLPVLLRIPKGTDRFYVEKAAEQSIKTGKTVSKNSLMVQVLEERRNQDSQA